MNKFIFTIENEQGRRRKVNILSHDIDGATVVYDSLPEFRNWEVISIEERHKRGAKPTWEEMSS